MHTQFLVSRKVYTKHEDKTLYRVFPLLAGHGLYVTIYKDGSFESYSVDPVSANHYSNHGYSLIEDPKDLWALCHTGGISYSDKQFCVSGELYPVNTDMVLGNHMINQMYGAVVIESILSPAHEFGIDPSFSTDYYGEWFTLLMEV